MGNQYKFKTLFDWCNENNRPDILQEWDYGLNTLTPKDVSYGSDTKIWWNCLKCHNKWFRRVGDRSSGRGCPECAKKQRIKTYKRTKANNNNLAEVRPDLVLEWHPTKNGTLRPQDLAVNSTDKVWWKCLNCGNEWISNVNNRNRGSGCPECVKGKQTSFPEQTLFFYIKEAYPDAKSRYYLEGLEFDIFISSINTAIEYDGVFWHSKDKAIKNEKIKDDYCEKNGIRLIRVRDVSLGNTDYAECIFCKDGNNRSLVDAISELMRILHQKVDVDINRDLIEIINQYQKEKRENSLLYRFPDIAKEWHPTKNGNLKPENIPAGYTKRIWWKCRVCGEEWQASPNSRIDIGRGKHHECPHCSMLKIKKGNLIRVKNVDTGIIYDSLTDASNATGISISKISACCKGKRKTTGGFHWEYYGTQKGRFGKDRHRIMNVDTGIIYDNALEAAKSCGKAKGNNIITCCKGINHTSYGYHWKFAGMIRIKNVETGQLFDTYDEAAGSVDGDYRAIKKCCEGLSNTAYGYRWEKIETDQ